MSWITLSAVVLDTSVVDSEIAELRKHARHSKLDKVPSCTFVPWFKNGDVFEAMYLLLHLPEEHRILCQNIENSFLFKAFKEA